MTVRLNENRVLEEWSLLLPGCAGEAPRVLGDIEHQLGAARLPGLIWTEESLSPSFLKGLLGRRRDCVRISHRKFKEVEILTGAHDHGSALQVFWIAAASPRVRNHLIRLIRFGFGSDERYTIGAELDLVQAWGLAGFLETTRAALRRAVQDLMRERKLKPQDPGLLP